MSQTRFPFSVCSVLVFCFLLTVFLSACGGSEEAGPSEIELKLTAEAGAGTVQDVAPTAAAEAPSAEATAAVAATAAPAAEESAPQQETVPSPTTLAPATVDPALEEAFATATAKAIEIEQTAEAAQLTTQATQDAEAARLAPIRDELRALGIDPDQGQLGFTHPPFRLQSTEFESYSFENQNALTVAQDFVMAADITWESRFAESGCGFVVRSNGDEEALDQYIIGLTRGAQGHVLFAEQKQGDVDLKDVTDIYANGVDPRFEWQSGTTNRVVVVGRGQQFDIYSNGTYLGTIGGGAGFEEGFVAFFAVNRSGGITCDFDNAYLWKLN